MAQMSGIFLPTRIDTWCKNVRRVHCYDAYMDDRIIIHHDKEFLRNLLSEIDGICTELGLIINRKKTQVVKISKGFTFLKTRYHLTRTGKIIRKIPKDVVKRQKRKMKKLALLVQENEITIADFEKQYKSWRGDKVRYNAKMTLDGLDVLYSKLCKELKQNGKRKAERIG